MCMSPRRKVMGRRLNAPQGLRPKSRIGISTTVVKCLDCGLVYSDPLPIPKSIEDHYGVEPEDYWHEGYFETKSFDDSRIKQFVPNAKTYLDIGAGIGETMRAIKDMDVWGIEPSKPFYDRALELGIRPDRLTNTTFEAADFPRMFDVISFSVVLEHLYDPSGSIEKALGWLNPGGIMYVEVPDSDYLMSKIFNLYFWLARTDFVVNLSPMHVRAQRQAARVLCRPCRPIPGCDHNCPHRHRQGPSSLDEANANGHGIDSLFAGKLIAFESYISPTYSSQQPLLRQTLIHFRPPTCKSPQLSRQTLLPSLSFPASRV